MVQWSEHWTYMATVARNNPKSVTYICISNKPATKQERSCLSKMSLQTDSDQCKMRAYIPVPETRQIIDVYKKVVPRKASIF
jgi:hypothetical protein